MNELIKRTLFGALYVVVVVASIVWLPTYVFAFLFAIITPLAVREYCILLNMCRVRTIILMIFSECFYWLTTWNDAFPMLRINLSDLGIFAVIIPMTLLIGTMALLFIDKPEWGLQRPRNINALFVNFMYVIFWTIIPFVFMNTLLSIDRLLLLAVFVLVWVNDTGAYCIGTLTAKLPGGNHKMAPIISPKKSWEGLFGGVAFSLLTGYILSLYIETCSWWQWVLFALFVSLVGTYGDLIESKVKRRAGVKDSGKFLPGHGGVLDRFDSILLVVLVMDLLWMVQSLFD